MSTLTDTSVSQALHDFTRMGKAAAARLAPNTHPHYPTSAVCISRLRRHIIPSSESTGFDPHPEEEFKKKIVRGWFLGTQPFFLSSESLYKDDEGEWPSLVIIWENRYFCTLATPANAETVSVFFSASEIHGAIDELIDIVAP